MLHRPKPARAGGQTAAASRGPRAGLGPSDETRAPRARPLPGVVGSGRRCAIPTKTTKEPAAKATPTTTVDDYIAAAPSDKRAKLKKLRATIKKAAPKTTESISYGIVGYKQNGERVAYFGYWKTHIALYGTSGRFIDAHAAELKPYVQTKGTIRFPDDKPLPYGLVAKIVKARVAEVDKTS